MRAHRNSAHRYTLAHTYTECRTRKDTCAGLVAVMSPICCCCCCYCSSNTLGQIKCRRSFCPKLPASFFLSVLPAFAFILSLFPSFSHLLPLSVRHIEAQLMVVAAAWLFFFLAIDNLMAIDWKHFLLFSEPAKQPTNLILNMASNTRTSVFLKGSPASLSLT